MVLVATAVAIGCGDDGDGAPATVAITTPPDPEPGAIEVAVDFDAVADGHTDSSLATSFRDYYADAVAVGPDGSVFVAGEASLPIRITGNILERIRYEQPRRLPADFASLAVADDVALLAGLTPGMVIRLADGTQSTLAGDEFPGQPLEPGVAHNATRQSLPLVTEAVAAGGTVYVGLVYPQLDAGETRSQVAVVSDGTIELLGGSRAEDCAYAGSEAIDAGFGRVSGLAVEADGSLLVADSACHRLWRISEAGVLSVVAGEDALGEPRDVVVGENGTAYVLDHTKDAVIAVDAAGNTSVAVAGNGQLEGATQMAIGPDGRLWITVGGNVLVARPADG